MSPSDDIRIELQFVPVMPPRGEAAFIGDSHEATLSRSAQLLLMTLLAVGSPSQRAGIAEDAALLGVPHVRSLGLGKGAKLSMEDLDSITAEEMSSRGFKARYRGSSWSDAPYNQSYMRQMWRRAEQSRRPETALAIATLSLNSKDNVERASAAAVVWAITGGRSGKAQGILSEASGHHIVAKFGFHRRPAQWGEVLASQIAAAASQTEKDRGSPDTWLGEALEPSEEVVPASIAIHGSFARLGYALPWWRPTSPLSEHIRDEADPHLYSRENHFRWSGRYNSAERLRAAEDFQIWKLRNGVDPVDTIYAHSHGGNVALNIIAAGQEVRLLVLLHTPASRRKEKEWERIRPNVGRVVSLRTRADLVMLVDALMTGSTLDFDQNKLPHRPLLPHFIHQDGWFSHDYYTRHDVWQQQKLAGDIRYERELARDPWSEVE